MKLVSAFWMGFLVLGLACDSQEITSQAVNETPKAAAQDEPDQAEKKNKDGAPKVIITLENKETGELKDVEANVEMRPGEKYYVPNFNPAATASFSHVQLVNQVGEAEKVELDRVVLVEYWSRDGLTQNQFWSQMRQLEQKYTDSEDIRLVSIQYDTALDGKDQIADGLSAIENFSAPKRVLFDLNDSFRDSFPVTGPVTYILIDGRQQITYFGRGDNPNTQEVFDNVRDALLHQDAKRTGGIKVVNREEN